MGKSSMRSPTTVRTYTIGYRVPFYGTLDIVVTLLLLLLLSTTI